MSRATYRGRRLLYINSFYSSLNLKSFYLFILFFAKIITVEATTITPESEIEIQTTTINSKIKINDQIQSLNLEDQKATTAKMIERIRDQSVERLLKLKIGMPSTSYADSEEDLFDDDESDEDQNVTDDSQGKSIGITATTSMTPLNSVETSSTSLESLGASGALRGRRSLRHSHHHRRRRKGCPTVHGKTQFLCPTRNSNRYDVCITREQLCNHIVDCPDGEDEDPKHCMFYQPIDDQLKTLSHAVLLLVDNVMGRETPKAEL